MCGIAGILRFDGRPVEAPTLHKMTSAIAHRGPDGSGHWQDGPIGLGHRRLSIIDLSADGNQPMLSTDGQSVIIFNGEIYNYRELAADLAAAGLPCRTKSDTEVILNLYRLHGPGCLEYLRGMFAFAIWDRARQRLFVARDRVGIKPLYFLRSATAFAFASEIKAITVAGLSALRVNWDALGGFMRFLVVPQPGTIFTDITKLEPGRYLLIQPDGRVEESIWWTPPVPGAAAGNLSEAAHIAALDATLGSSVAYHMVADVPVGAFLSGGLDSGAVVSLMRKAATGHDIHAFSVGFPGLDEYDESPYARAIADLKRLDYHAANIDARFIDDLPQIMWHMDEPHAETSGYATWYLARYAAQQMKVVLTGDGGDELFAGYEGYKNNAYLKGPFVSAVSSWVFAALYAGAKLGVVRGYLLERVLPGLARRAGSEGMRYSEQVAQNSMHAMSLALAPDALFNCVDHWGQNLLARYYDQFPSADRLCRKLYAEFRTRLVDEMLMKVDRMSMAHSLEARVPILDHVVVEQASRLPPDLKIRTAPGASPVSKYALKKVMENYLPAELVYRRKQGFNIPVRHWLQEGLLDSVRDRIMGGQLRAAGVIREKGVRMLLANVAGERHNYVSMLMALLALETWADVYASRVGKVSWH